jgi:SOS-response transcriptional repressor LexA
MEPSLPDGSLVIIDRDDRRIRPMRPFLVRLDSGATVKYVELDGQELVLIPENRTHREQRVRLEAGQESPVAGAVLWSWRAWPGAEEEPDGHGATAERRGRYRAGKAKG